MKMSHVILLMLMVSITAIIGFVQPQSAIAEQRIQKIETRPGVTIKFLLNTTGTASKGTLLLFPGSHGEGHFSEDDGQIKLGGNFLVRTSPSFVQKGFSVAIVDVPSDQEDGMSDGFRTSHEHAQDIAKVIEYLKGNKLGPFYLVGTSRGTISVAYLATVLHDDALKGVVLTSTLAAVGSLPLDKITLPVLLVHHRNDGCSVSPFSEAADLKERLKVSPKVDFIEIQGGASPEDNLALAGKRGRQQVNPCKAMSHHGYIGVEDKVVNAITDWLSGKPVPSKAGD